MSQTPPPPHSIYRYSLYKRRTPRVAGSILKSVLKHHGLEKKLAKYEFVVQWKEIVGGEIAKRSRPEHIRNNTLIVAVENSIWAQELSFQKDIILRRLKAATGFDSVTDIHFRVSELSSYR